MRLAAPAPREMHGWLAQRARVTAGPTFHAIAAIDDNGGIAGMVGFDGWLPNACSMHVALEDPHAFWTLVRPAFGIPFDHYGFACVVAPVVSTNKRSLRFVKGLGFREKASFRDAFGRGVDLVLFEMRREHCRWLRPARKAA